MAKQLRGAPVAKAIVADLKERTAALRERGVTPTLTIVRVGNNPDDISYEHSAIRRCAACGVSVRRMIITEKANTRTVVNCIREINEDEAVHGVLLFLPLPRSIDETAVRETLAPEKDMDGITEGSMAGVFTGSGTGYPPCTAWACMEILDYYGIDPAGKRATIMGRSNIAGKPAAMLLLQKNATVTICHTKTPDTVKECSRADIIVAAVGRPGTIGVGHTRIGQTILDVGINVLEDGSVTGDVDYENVEHIAGAITPVPAGVGPVTTAVLAKHVVEAAEKFADRRDVEIREAARRAAAEQAARNARSKTKTAQQ